VGIPIELALASVDQRLREEGIVGGSIRNSSDVVKAVALGADCHTGKCNWGIATQEPELVNLTPTWAIRDWLIL